MCVCLCARQKSPLICDSWPTFFAQSEENPASGGASRDVCTRWSRSAGLEACKANARGALAIGCCVQRCTAGGSAAESLTPVVQEGECYGRRVGRTKFNVNLRTAEMVSTRAIFSTEPQLVRASRQLRSIRFGAKQSKAVPSLIVGALPPL